MLILETNQWRIIQSYITILQGSNHTIYFPEKQRVPAYMRDLEDEDDAGALYRTGNEY